MPVVAGGASTATLPSASPGWAVTAAFRAARLPTARTLSRRPSLWIEIPAESYPRYSSFSRPARRTSCTDRCPTYPTMPHTGPCSFPAVILGRTGRLPAPRPRILVVDRGSGLTVGSGRRVHQRRGGEPLARTAGAVGGHDPGLVLRAVEQVAVIQPRELVVDRVGLR